MKLLVAIALLFTASAAFPSEPAKAKASKAVKAQKPGKQAKEAKPAEQQAPAVDPADQAAARKAREKFRRFSALCPGGKCEPADKEIVDNSDAAYLKACKVCSTAEKCDADRAEILKDGGKRLGPCD